MRCGCYVRQIHLTSTVKGRVPAPNSILVNLAEPALASETATNRIAKCIELRVLIPRCWVRLVNQTI